MANFGSEQARIEFAKTAVENNAVLQTGIRLDVGTYEFRILDAEKAFDVKETTFKTGANAGKPLNIFLVKGEVKDSNGKVYDKGFKFISVDNPELWATMKNGVTYNFDVIEYEQTVNDKVVLRKGTQNWIPVS